MMNKLHVVSSGSKANAYIIETKNGMLLIDQGLTFKRFSEKCNELGIDIGKIKAILLTHEHSDHICGVPVTAKKLGIPVFVSPELVSLLNERCKSDIDVRPVKKDEVNNIEGFSFTPFPVMHDTVDPLGYSVTLPNGENIGFATDTGKITNHILKYLSEANYIVIEANHDCDMLHKNQKYSWELKQRIKSNTGHLSNDQCFEALDRLPKELLKKVILVHLSEENNCTMLLQNLTTNFIREKSRGFQHFIATQDNPFSVLMT